MHEIKTLLASGLIVGIKEGVLQSLGLTHNTQQHGGERGIRTLDELLTHTPLAGERLRPLGHLSV